MIKYHKFDNLGTEILKLFFEKNFNIIDMNLTYASLEDVPLEHIEYVPAESIISKDKSPRFWT